MIGNLIAGFIENVYNFFGSTFASVSYDLLFCIGVGLMIVLMIIGFVRIGTSYEAKTMRGINRINKYLLQNPSITDSNLVVFHNLMKKMPQRIRDRWQLYVLERDGLPSKYLTAEYCIRRQISNSAIVNAIKQIKMSAIISAAVFFLLGLSYAISNTMGSVFEVRMYALTVPALILLLANVFGMIAQLRFSSLNGRIYDAFGLFVRNVNRAVVTMPDTIDYEVLFTREEIDNGIPILREYLEKKSLEEQQLLEQNKYNAVAHSPYDFADLGVDGQQLITRAVDESENFLMKKLGLQGEIQEFEKKMTQAQDNMDEIEKEANRKLQTIKENLERLEKAIAETTNRVEINYNRRQMKDELDKKAAIEKDLKSLLSKEQVTVNEAMAEIEKRRVLIEQDKDNVQVALKSEYKTFAGKVYDTLNDKVNEENLETIKEYQLQIVDLKAKIQNLSREIEKKDAVIAEKDLFINVAGYKKGDKAKNEPQVDNNGSYTTMEPQEEGPNLMTSENVQQQEQGYYDKDGNIIDYTKDLNSGSNNSQEFDTTKQLFGLGQENVSDEGMDNEEIKDDEQESPEKIEVVADAVPNEPDVVTQYVPENVDENFATFTQENAPVEEEPIVTMPENEEKNEEETDKSEFDGYNHKNSAVLYDDMKSSINSQQYKTIDIPDVEHVSFDSITSNLDNASAPSEDVQQKQNEILNDLAQNAQNNNVEANGTMSSYDTTQLLDKEQSPGNQYKVAEISPDGKGFEPIVDMSTIKDESNFKPIEDTTDMHSAHTAPSAVPSFLQGEKDNDTTDVDLEKVLKAEEKESAKDKKQESKPKSDKENKPKTDKKVEEKAEKKEKTSTKKEMKDDFNEIQKQIDAENQKLQQQKQELQVQIDKALSKIEKSSTEASRASSIKKIKTLIDQLKEQAKQAKADGASKQEIKQINSSVAELVEALTKYSSKK